MLFNVFHVNLLDYPVEHRFKTSVRCFSLLSFPLHVAFYWMELIVARLTGFGFRFVLHLDWLPDKGREPCANYYKLLGVSEEDMASYHFRRVSVQ